MTPASLCKPAAATALAIILSSCGGGGGGGSAPVGGTPAPTSSPAAAPTPSPPAANAALPPAPFGIVASQQFQPFGWLHRGSVIEPLSPALVDFRWSASARTYEMVLPDIGRGRLEYQFPGSPNRLAFKIVADDGSVLPVDVTVDDTRFYDPPYRSGLLSWASSAPAPNQKGSAVFGFPTSAAHVPSTGTVSYLAQSSAEGDALVIIDFGAGTIGGFVRLAWVDAWGPYAPNRYELTPARLIAGSNGFEARFTVPGAPFEGVLRVQFMGVNGEELAIAWRGPVQDPYTNAWTEQAGVWLARDCSRCETPS